MNRLLRFDGRVVVVTGAGGGLGKAYALLFAERGASVVVNDLGGTAHGEGSNKRAADAVVDEIVQKGGKAVANYDSVTNGENIIKLAVEKFGRIDVLVNNAGILRDKSFAKMTEGDWDLINQVHVKGAFKTTRSAWDHFRAQKYGRIVNTSSVAGILGNFGQANYSSAKCSLIGFSKTLAQEGEKFNILTNVIVPMAGSRLTENILPPDLHATLKPELIAPVVVWMCHEDFQNNGTVIESAAGFAARYNWFRSNGALLRSRLDGDVTPENVREKWEQIIDMKNPEMPENPAQAMGAFQTALEKLETGTAIDKDNITPNNLPGFSAPNIKYEYKQDETILYALGLGMSTSDPEGLNYLYENSDDFRVLPTFPVLAGFDSMFEIFQIPKLNIDFTKLLHGEQYVEIYRPLPSSGSIRLQTKVVDVLDKISGGLYIIRVDGEDDDGPIYSTEYSIFVVGGGKFGGRRETDKPITRPVNPPKRSPDAVFEYKTGIDQAALYRLSGDKNPLHLDPNFALMGGFSKPILHGLCSYGIAARILLQNYAESDPKLFKSIKARFAKPVYPGETLIIESWRGDKNRIHFEVKVKESGVSAITGGYMDLKEIKQKSKL